VYCSQACRLSGSRASHQQAQHRYRQTAKGKRAHCLAENGRRQRKKQATEKNMDDATSRLKGAMYILSAKNEKGVPFKLGGHGFCHFCGRVGVIVKRFARRGYCKGVYETVFQ